MALKNNELLNQRCRHSAVVYKDSILILGGRDAKTKKRSDSIHSLNTKTFKWNKDRVTGDNPRHLPHYEAVVVGEQLIVLGGCGYDFEIYSLDLVTLRWLKIEKKGFSPHPRYSYSATVYNGKIFIFGGWVSDCELRINSNELLCFDVNLKEWTVPEASGTPPCYRKDHGGKIRTVKNLVVVVGLKAMKKFV